MSKRRRAVLIAAGVLVLICGGVTIWIGPFILAIARNGFLEAPLKSTYTGDTVANLKNLHQAMMLYHESEGQFPLAAGWMDAAWDRMKTADLSQVEAKKKFRSPLSQSEEEYGYAFNQAASGKYKGDLKPDDILIFESDKLTWNAVGAPEKKRGITVAGKIVEAKTP